MLYLKTIDSRWHTYAHLYIIDGMLHRVTAEGIIRERVGCVDVYVEQTIRERNHLHQENEMFAAISDAVGDAVGRDEERPSHAYERVRQAWSASVPREVYGSNTAQRYQTQMREEHRRLARQMRPAGSIRIRRDTDPQPF